MEDVLEVYHRPYDERRQPLGSAWTEASKQLIGETVQPLPAEPGQAERFDYEYVRNGTANLFMISEPLLGWRACRSHCQATDGQGLCGGVSVLRLVEDLHPDADKVVLVMDNLNTHKLASLYEAFPPDQARRIAERLEIHHTPKHGSWLNVAEIEASVSWPDSVWTGASAAAETLSLRKSGPGKKHAMSKRSASTGASPLPMPALSSADFTHRLYSGGLLEQTYTVQTAGQEYQIPSLEMALTMKFAPLISEDRAQADRFQDAHDFMCIIKSNPEINLPQLAIFGKLVYNGGGAKIVEMVRQVRADEKLVL